MITRALLFVTLLGCAASTPPESARCVFDPYANPTELVSPPARSPRHVGALAFFDVEALPRVPELVPVITSWIDLHHRGTIDRGCGPNELTRCAATSVTFSTDALVKIAPSPAYAWRDGDHLDVLFPRAHRVVGAAPIVEGPITVVALRLDEPITVAAELDPDGSIDGRSHCFDEPEYAILQLELTRDDHGALRLAVASSDEEPKRAH